MGALLGGSTSLVFSNDTNQQKQQVTNKPLPQQPIQPQNVIVNNNQTNVDPNGGPTAPALKKSAVQQWVEDHSYTLWALNKTKQKLTNFDTICKNVPSKGLNFLAKVVAPIAIGFPIEITCQAVVGYKRLLEKYAYPAYNPSLLDKAYATDYYISAACRAAVIVGATALGLYFAGNTAINLAKLAGTGYVNYSLQPAIHTFSTVTHTFANFSDNLSDMLHHVTAVGGSVSR